MEDSPVGVPNEKHQERERNDDRVGGSKRCIADDEQ